ncbi:MAG: recombinase family protein [Tissierellaceae bacterium]|nr:recombinase family protein [Tissierellaceae bacterium]
MKLHEIRQELNAGKSIFDLPLRVAYYTRVSTSTDEQIHSLKAQTQYFDEYVNSIKSWTITDGYIDEGLSGISTQARKEFNRMIEDARQKKFDLLITKEVSRFARNTLDSIFYTRELLKNGVGVYFQNDNINTLLPDSELRLTIMASMAQEESRKISERVKWGKRRKLESGAMHITGRINGYDIVDGKYEINEEEATMIRLIFDLYCDGVGFRRIADELLNKGYRNENGNKFGYSTLRRILTNPRYKGYFTGNQTTTVDFLTKEYVENPKEEWIMYYDPEQAPVIVSEEIWDKANEMLKVKAKKVALKHETSYQNKYKYSGKITCKEHQNSFYRTNYRYKSGDREVWMCQEYHKSGKKACDLPVVYTEEIDRIMSVVFNSIFKDKNKYYDKIVNMISKYIQETSYDKDIKTLIGEIEGLKKKKDKLLELVVNEFIDNDEFKKRNDEYNLQIQTKQEQVKKYEVMNDQKYNVKEQLLQIKKVLEREYNFDGFVNDEMIDTFLDKIEISNGEIKNTLNIDIILKAGNEVKAVYSKDISLPLITHVLRADIATEVSPLIGTEKQSEELIQYLLSEFEGEPSKIWQSNLFGKSLFDLVNEQLQGKLGTMPEDARQKLRRALEKIINDGSGGLICIII